MPQRLSRSRRVETAARWPLGSALTSWRYMWRTTPMRRLEIDGSHEQDASPPIPAGLSTIELQLPEDGVGPLLHRTYRVRIRDARVTAEQLVPQIAEDPDGVAPSEFATSTRSKAKREACGSGTSTSSACRAHGTARCV